MTEENKWHVKKEVSVGHLLTTLTMALTVLWWATSVETRLAVLETQNANTTALFDRIEKTLDRIEDKLDRKADRNGD